MGESNESKPLFVSQLSVKFEFGPFEVKRHSARQSPKIAAYVDKHNNRRPHTALGGSTPAQWYFSGLNARPAAQLALAA